MSTGPHQPIAFFWKTKEINNLKWAATRNIILDIILISKFVGNKYITKFGHHSDSISRKTEKLFIKKKSKLGGVNSNTIVMNSSVKCMSNYRASRLAHYQDQMYDEAANVGSLRPSRRSSNLSGFSINSQYGTPFLQPTQEQFHQLLIDDDLNNNNNNTNNNNDNNDNNNVRNFTSDDVPTTIHCAITQTSKSTDSKSECKLNNPNRENKAGARSPSIDPTADINDRVVFMSLPTQTTLDATDLSPLASRGNPISRNNPSSRACYFCWCCCCSCSCLNIKPKLEEPLRSQISNDPQSKFEAISNEEKITLEEAQKWCHNFDLLMQSSAGRKVFHEFLKLEYSEENIMFYRAVEELQVETNMDIVEEKARAIYEDYISILSPKEVSLDSRVRELINSQMVEPSPHTFDDAQLQIFTLMQRDSYPRFLNSRLYKDFLHQLGGSSTTSNSQSITETRPNNSS